MTNANEFNPASLRASANNASSPPETKIPTPQPSELEATIAFDKSHVDYYPAAIRAVENHGTEQQVAALHRVEHHQPDPDPKPATADLYPGLRSANLPSFHALPAETGVAKGAPSADLYPGVIRQVENSGSQVQVEMLRQMEKKV